LNIPDNDDHRPILVRTSELSTDNGDYLACLDQHPDFASESEFTQYCMTLFSRGLSGIASQGTFELRPSSEAKDEDVLVAEHAAITRLRPIQDGLDY
jgi:hypothetical protein